MIRSYRSALRYAEEMGRREMEQEGQGDKPVTIIPTAQVREDGTLEFIKPKMCECCGRPYGGAQ